MLRLALVMLLAAGCGRLEFGAPPSGTGDDSGITADVSTASSYPQAVLASGPYAYYRLDEATPTAIDASGNGRDVPVHTLNGGVVQHQVAGALIGDADTAVMLVGDDGDGDFAAIDTPEGEAIWGGEWTIEMFVKMLALPGSNPFGLMVCETYNNNNPGTGNGFRTGITAGPVMRFWNTEANGATSIASPDPGTMDTWYHLVVTRQTGFVTVYLDGGAVHGQAVTDYMAPTGPYTDCGIGALHGMMTNIVVDEVAFYARALPLSEVTAHYAASGR